MTKDEVLAAYVTAGKSIVEIARDGGTTPWKLKKILQSSGVAIRPGGPKILDMTGQRHGRLQVLSIGKTRKDDSGSTTVFWCCRCDCGRQKEASGYSLRKGLCTTCGKCEYRANYKGVGELPGTYFSSVKNNAKTRKIHFKVSVSQLWALFLAQNRCCALTGLPLVFAPPGKIAVGLRSKFQTASLDRIDSSKGYTADNVQWVHKDINYMKSDLTEVEFIALCTQVTKHCGQHV